MARNPLNDPVAHLTAMVGQLVRQNQTLIGHIDRVAGSLSEIAQDMRVQQSGTGKAIDGLRTEIHGLRTEMRGRFDAVGTRLDDMDERLVRLARNLDALRSDILRLENGVLNAQQSALEAHLRLDDDGQPDNDS